MLHIRQWESLSQGFTGALPGSYKDAWKGWSKQQQNNTSGWPNASHSNSHYVWKYGSTGLNFTLLSLALICLRGSALFSCCVTFCFRLVPSCFRFVLFSVAVLAFLASFWWGVVRCLVRFRLFRFAVCVDCCFACLACFFSLPPHPLTLHLPHIIGVTHVVLVYLIISRFIWLGYHWKIQVTRKVR